MKWVLWAGELDARAKEFARRKLRNINIVTNVATDLAEELSRKQGSLDREMSEEDVQAVRVTDSPEAERRLLEFYHFVATLWATFKDGSLRRPNIPEIQSKTF